MNFNKYNKVFFALTSLFLIVSCKAPIIVENEANTNLPPVFLSSKDTTNSAFLPWKSIFKDSNLVDLIDTALKNNQELLSTLQEIEIAKSEIRARKGELLPFVGYGAGIGTDKTARFTAAGAGNAATDITEGLRVPEPINDFRFSLNASWEIDVWKKLRNAKKAAIQRYLASIEGKNFLVTNLISEVAQSYYELLALDAKKEAVLNNIQLQQKALEIVKLQKEAGRTSEFAVQKFEAEVLDSKNKEIEINQEILETENKINFLLARMPQKIERTKSNFVNLPILNLNVGVPTQLLTNRPDVKQAEMQLKSAKLDLKVARARFFPSVGISAAFGLQAFRTNYLFNLPESILYNLAADIAGPLVNKNAIKADFNAANAKQLQALYDYQKTILTAYLETYNQINNASNLQKSLEIKSKQVDILNNTIDISDNLFKSARIDYFEVLMTQRDALDAKIDLIETKQNQLKATILLYKNIGGGWK